MSGELSATAGYYWFGQQKKCAATVASGDSRRLTGLRAVVTGWTMESIFSMSKSTFWIKLSNTPD